MYKNLLLMYSLIVSLICVVILVVTLSQVVSNAFYAAYPYYSQRFDNLAYDDNFSEQQEEEGDDEMLPIKEDLRYKESRELFSIKLQSIKSIISHLPWIIVTSICLLIHVVIYKRQKKCCMKNNSNLATN